MNRQQEKSDSITHGTDKGRLRRQLSPDLVEALHMLDHFEKQYVSDVPA
jgi:hypothetical protein